MTETQTKLGMANYISFAFVVLIIVLFVFASPFTLGIYYPTETGMPIKKAAVGGLERSFLMLAVMSFPMALCHGFALKVQRRWAKVITSPWFIWPLMSIGIIGALIIR